VGGRAKPGHDTGWECNPLEALISTQALGRPGDLVERTAIAQTRNPFRRRRILQDAEPVYVAG
jgi:hypothetical protein